MIVCPKGHTGPFRYVDKITNYYLVEVEGDRIIRGPIDSQDNEDEDALECQHGIECVPIIPICMTKFPVPDEFTVVDYDCQDDDWSVT